MVCKIQATVDACLRPQSGDRQPHALAVHVGMRRIGHHLHRECLQQALRLGIGQGRIAAQFGNPIGGMGNAVPPADSGFVATIIVDAFHVIHRA